MGANSIQRDDGPGKHLCMEKAGQLGFKRCKPPGTVIQRKTQSLLAAKLRAGAALGNPALSRSERGESGTYNSALKVG